MCGKSAFSSAWWALINHSQHGKVPVRQHLLVLRNSAEWIFAGRMLGKSRVTTIPRIFASCRGISRVHKPWSFVELQSLAPGC